MGGYHSEEGFVGGGGVVRVGLSGIWERPSWGGDGEGEEEEEEEVGELVGADVVEWDDEEGAFGEEWVWDGSDAGEEEDGGDADADESGVPQVEPQSETEAAPAADIEETREASDTIDPSPAAEITIQPIATGTESEPVLENDTDTNTLPATSPTSTPSADTADLNPSWLASMDLGLW